MLLRNLVFTNVFMQIDRIQGYSDNVGHKTLKDEIYNRRCVLKNTRKAPCTCILFDVAELNMSQCTCTDFYGTGAEGSSDLL